MMSRLVKLAAGSGDGTCSSEELHHRKLLAQGYFGLGDISLMTKIHNQEVFRLAIHELCRYAYPNVAKDEAALIDFADSCYKRLWGLLNIRAGDVVLVFDGITPKSVGIALADARESYRYDDTGSFEYAQTVCHGIELHPLDPGLIQPLRLSAGNRGPRGVTISTNNQAAIDGLIEYIERIR